MFSKLSEKKIKKKKRKKEEKKCVGYSSILKNFVLKINLYVYT
jgi:hypothetical protein